MINKAFDNDMVDGEVIKTFKKVKKLLKGGSNARTRVLSPVEYKRLSDNAAGHLKGVLATGYYMGMRLSEILNLTWEKVDFKSDVIRLEAHETKDREQRTIPICDGLRFELNNIPRAVHDSHVFLYDGKPMQSIKHSLMRACSKAGTLYGKNVKGGFIFHDLRHTFNTNMRKAGVPEGVIMEITGHSTRQMFDRYNTIDEQDKRQAIDCMTSFLQNVEQKQKRG